MGLTITENLAYWHMPKTGGMSVYKYLQAGGDNYQIVSGYARHGRAETIASSILKGRTLFGTIRNPWHWYASLYQMAMRSEEGQEILMDYGNGSLEFRPVLRGLTRPLEVEKFPKENFGIIFQIENGSEEIWADDFLSSGLGLFSWVFRYCYGRPIKPDVFVDTQQLVAGVSELLLCSPEVLKGINPQNKAEHFPYNYLGPAEDLYETDMIEWIYESDVGLIETFGFEPFKQMKSPTVNASDLLFSPSFIG